MCPYLITDTTIAGGTGTPLTYGIDMVYDSLRCDNVHFEECESAIHINGIGNHVLINVTGQDTVTNVVEIHEDFAGTLLTLGCSRRGATNLIKDNRVGGVGTISYDLSFYQIDPEPPVTLGANLAGGTFDGGSDTPATTFCYGVSSIARNSTGDYTVTLSRPGTSAFSFSVQANSNTQGGSVDCNLVGSSTVKLVNRGPANGGVAGSPTNANEIHFTVARCA
ncbi:MAG: hypothetical protein IR159_05275 [Brevundimonas sp.]|nr:hypothetical protein [Brevundimonas sp.]